MCRLSELLVSICFITAVVAGPNCEAQQREENPPSVRAFCFCGAGVRGPDISRTLPTMPMRRGSEQAERSNELNPDDALVRTATVPLESDDAASLAAFSGQAVPPKPKKEEKAKSEQVNANWLYGAYLPNNVQRRPLTARERWRLYALQTFVSPGIYAKTTGFALYDHAADSQPAWGSDISGFVKRWGNRHAQFVIQNSVASLGNGLVGWDPRYDRCKCSGFWSRTGHATLRNFVTYGPTEDSFRPQLMPYLGAFAASAVATTWQPGRPLWQVRGYQAAITQIFVGAGNNVIAEFGAELGRMFRRR